MSHIAIPLCRITFMLERLNRNFAKQKCIKFVYIDGFVFVKLVITAVFYMSRIHIKHQIALKHHCIFPNFIEEKKYTYLDF